MRVAVTYAERLRQTVLEFDVADNTTAEAAIRQCGVLLRFPEIDLSVNKIGIFGKLIALDQVLHEGERVEIYRPAQGKPKKKERAAKTVAAGDEDASEDAEDAPAAPAAEETDKAARAAAAKERAAAAKAKLAAKKESTAAS
ncbi:MAG: RnfH family protein [Magnetococcus sp. WYHC-3]